MFDGLRKWRAQRLGRKTVHRLYPVLIRRYGRHESYTAGQIVRALEVSGLSRTCWPYALAVFAAPGPTDVPPHAGGRIPMPPVAADDGMISELRHYAHSWQPHRAEDGNNAWWSVGGTDDGTGMVGDGGGGDGGGDG